MSDENVSQAPVRKPVPVFPGPKETSATVLLTEDQLTPYEREQLAAKFQYTGGVVPSNIADLMPEEKAKAQANFQAAVQAAANATVEGFSLPTKGLDFDKIPTVNDPEEVNRIFAEVAAKMGNQPPLKSIPAATSPPAPVEPPQMSEFERIRNAAVAQAQKEQATANMDPSVAKAMQDLEREYDGSQPRTNPRTAESENEDAKAKQADELNKVYELLKTMVDPEDAEIYREAVYSMARFEKTYDLFGGDVQITFSNYGADEDAMIVMQEAIDIRQGRVDQTDLSSMLMNSARYTFAACLRQVHVVRQNVKPVAVPDRMSLAEFLSTLPRESMHGLTGVVPADTNIRLWYRFLATKAIPDAMYRVAFKKFEDFRKTLTTLERLAQYPRFFDRPTQ